MGAALDEQHVVAGETGSARQGGAGLDMVRFAAASEATWPGERVELIGGWRLRLGDPKAGSRANSVWAAGPPGIATEAAVDAAEQAYAAAGLTACMQIWPGDDAVDDVLEARGWTLYDPCLILARPLDEPWPEAPRDTVAIRLDAPLAMAERLWTQGGIGPARQAVFHRAAGAKALFMGRVGQRPAGMIGVSLDGGVAVTQALWVDPACRGKGLGVTLMGAAGRAAAALGARVMAHAVVSDNAPARALYARLGFGEIGHYHYRRAPA
ncbi:MAG: GNAT family N-acetyltransferase [Pseudomonadota bacterium]